MFLLSRNLVLTILLSMPQVVFSNAIGTDFQIFNPTSDADRYFTVNSTKTLLAGQLNLGIFIDGAMNTLPESTTQTTTDAGRRLGYQDFVITNIVHIGFGILKGWDIGFSAPFTWQTIKEDSNKVVFDAEGQTEFRLNTKIRLWGNYKTGIALVGTASLNRILDNPYMGDDSNQSDFEKLNYQVELVFGKRFDESFDSAINLGYRLRNPGPSTFPDSPIDPLGDQITGSVAVGWKISKRWRWIAEVYGAYTLDEVRSNLYRLQNPVEFVTGVKFRVIPYLYLYAGLGTEIVHSIGSPDFRGFAGVNWSPRLYRRKKRIKKATEPETSAPAIDNAPIPSEDINTLNTPGLPDSSSEFDNPLPDSFGDETPSAEKPALDEVPTEKLVIENIYFKTGSDSNMLSSSIAEIAKVAEHLKNTDFDRLVIEGHTDAVGNENSNLVLSKNRAATIKRVLVRKFGIDETLIFTEGFGESRPIASNSSAGGRQKNRRVEFKIYTD